MIAEGENLIHEKNHINVGTWRPIRWRSGIGEVKNPACWWTHKCFECSYCRHKIWATFASPCSDLMIPSILPGTEKMRWCDRGHACFDGTEIHDTTSLELCCWPWMRDWFLDDVGVYWYIKWQYCGGIYIVVLSADGFIMLCLARRCKYALCHYPAYSARILHNTENNDTEWHRSFKVTNRMLSIID